MKVAVLYQLGWRWGAKKENVSVYSAHAQLFFLEHVSSELDEFVDMECVALESRLPQMWLLLSA